MMLQKVLLILLTLADNPKVHLVCLNQLWCGSEHSKPALKRDKTTTPTTYEQRWTLQLQVNMNGDVLLPIEAEEERQNIQDQPEKHSRSVTRQSDEETPLSRGQQDVTRGHWTRV